MPTSTFSFNSKMVFEARISSNKKEKGKNPLHESLAECSDFIKESWDLWIHLIPVLKKELRKQSPRKSLKESNGEPLFSLEYADKKFKFHILQEWASERLELPKITVFSDLLDFYTGIVCRSKLR